MVNFGKKLLTGFIVLFLMIFLAEKAECLVTFSMDFTAGGPGIYKTGSKLTFSAVFTAPSGQWVTGDISYTSSITGPENDSNNSNSITHTFNTPGKYTVIITATGKICWKDENGNEVCDNFVATATTGTDGVIIGKVEIITIPTCVEKGKNTKLTATGEPSGGTFTWSKVSGEGDGTFSPNGTTGADKTTFTGTTEGCLNIQVTYSFGAGLNLTSESKQVIVYIPCSNGNPVTTATYVVAANPNYIFPECTVGASGPIEYSNGGIIVNITACLDCSSKVWHLKVESITSKVQENIRLLPGQSEPNPVDGGNTKSSNFCTQAYNMNNLGGPCATSLWDLLSGVKAHEDVHVNDWESAFNNVIKDLVQTLEGLNVAVSDDVCSKSKAVESLKALSDYDFTILAEYMIAQADWETISSDPNARAIAAETKVFTDMRKKICKYADKNGWDTKNCTSCSGK